MKPMSLEERFLTMQETKKTWRASVAGLASVAMIATMGVAAVTANAADKVEWTFNSNGLNGNKTVTVADEGTQGVIDDQDISNAETELGIKGDTKLTGWYTEPEIGSGQAVEPKVSKDSVVYAHWSAENSQYTVNFASGTYVTGGVNKVTLASTDTAIDRVSDWQIPSTDKQDGQIVTGWQAGGVTVDPKSDLRNEVFVDKTDTVTFTPVVEDAYVVTFGSYDFAGKQWELNGANAQIKVDVRKNSTLEAEGIDIPNAVRVSDKRQVTDWAVDEGSWPNNMKKGDAFTASTAVTNDVVVRPSAAEDYHVVTFYSESNTLIKQTTVADGDTIESVKPADPTKTSTAVKYEFAGWYESGATEPYDLSTKVEKNVDLYAKFKATAIRLDFNPNYGQEQVISRWYSDGDSFTLPELNRDGYTLLSWTYSVPENVVFTIGKDGDGNPALTYRSANGKIDYIPAGRVYTAKWMKTNKIELSEVEGYVVVSNGQGGYLSGDDQVTFTAASYDQYIKDYQQYLNDKEQAEKSGLTVSEKTQLVKELSEAQAKLIFNRTLDVTRLYNDGTRRHNLTKDANEVKVNTLNGFHVEGVAFKAVDYDKVVGNGANGAVLTEAGAKVLLKTVYRYYNAGIDRQLYTADDNEVKTLEQTGWRHEADNDLYVPANGESTVYRYYITATMEHVLTTDLNEYETLTNLDPGMYKGDAMTFNL